MDSYRVEKRAVQHIQLADADAEIEPVPADGGDGKREPEVDRLSNILKTFNDQFGGIEKVAADTAYQNAKQNSDKQNARIET